MSVEMGPSGGRTDDRETVAAVEDIGGRSHLVVADVTRDDAWVAVTEESAAELPDWV